MAQHEPLKSNYTSERLHTAPAPERVTPAPAPSTLLYALQQPADMLRLQRLVGNQAIVHQLSKVAQRLVIQRKTIEESLRSGTRMAIAGETHGKIDEEVERAYWNKKGFEVAYESDLIEMSIPREEGAIVAPFAPDNPYLVLLHNASLIEERIQEIIKTTAAQPALLPTFVKQSSFITQQLENIPYQIKMMQLLNQGYTGKGLPPRYPDQDINTGSKIAQSVAALVETPSPQLAATFRGEIAQAKLPVPTQSIQMNRSLHMFSIIDKVGKNFAVKPTVYKVGDHHIVDMRLAGRASDFEIKSEGDYRAETGL